MFTFSRQSLQRQDEGRGPAFQAAEYSWYIFWQPCWVSGSEVFLSKKPSCRFISWRREEEEDGGHLAVYLEASGDEVHSHAEDDGGEPDSARNWSRADVTFRFSIVNLEDTIKSIHRGMSPRFCSRGDLKVYIQRALWLACARL